jgi:antitoxin YefM
VIVIIAVNYTHVSKNLKEVCDIAVSDFETIIITRESGDNVVLMSEAEYNNLKENLYIRSNKKDYERLLKSINQLETGKFKQREIEDIE